MKLSKVLSLVLAIAMLLSVPTFAYNDVAADANYAEAVTALSALNIFTGYEDGSFKPEGKITRAEYAAIVCRVNNMEHAAKANKVGGIFTDVAADHWASGYIATAAQAGIVNGMGDGTFKPEAEVTYEQAVKMLVAALGYEPKAQTMGGYPTGYMMIANQESITVGTTNTVGGASRGTVAQLTYNALTVPLMAQYTWGTTEEIGVNKAESLLWTKLNAIKADVTFTDISLKKNETDVKVEYSRADLDVVSQNNWQKICEFNAEGDNYDKKYPFSVKINGVDLSGLQGLKVTTIIDVSDVNQHKLVCVTPRAGKNIEVVVNPKLLANPVNGEYAEYYKTNDDEKVSKLKLATDDSGTVTVKAYVNLEVGDYSKDIKAGGNTNDVAYRYVDTDNDGDFDTVFVDEEQVFIVGSVNTSNGKIFRDTSATAGATYKQASITLDANDVTLDWSITDTEGTAMELADIEEGAIVAIRTSTKDSGTFHEIIVSNETAEGTIMEKYDDKTKVGNVPFTKYTVGEDVYTLLDEAMTAPELGDEIVAKVYGDKIVAYEVSEGIKNYGLIIAKDDEKVYEEDVYQVQMLTQKGEVVSIKLAEKVNEVTMNKATFQADFTKGALIAYALNKDGELKSYDVTAPATGKNGNVVSAGTKFDGNTKGAFKASSERLDSYYITENTVVFTTGKEIKTTTVGLGSIEFFNEDTPYNYSIIADSNKEAKAVVLFNAQNAIDYTNKPFVIVKVSTITVAGDKRTKLTGYVAGEEASITLADTMADTLTASMFEVGDIIVYSTNAVGELYDAKWLVANNGSTLVVADNSTATVGTDKDGKPIAIKDDNKDEVKYNNVILDVAAFTELNKEEDWDAAKAAKLAEDRMTAKDSGKTIKGFGIAGSAYRVQGNLLRVLGEANYEATFTAGKRDYDVTDGDEKLITDVTVNANEIAYYYNAKTEKFKVTSIADAETDYISADYKNAGQFTNDDFVYIYNYDGETKLILVVDVNGDNY
ncbi:MAG: S-layer homology domain-containing protein [Clostridia bacterium]|nr:S-layer homology domain-containing protein [Clostridia bacterium]